MFVNQQMMLIKKKQQEPNTSAFKNENKIKQYMRRNRLVLERFSLAGYDLNRRGFTSASFHHSICFFDSISLFFLSSQNGRENKTYAALAVCECVRCFFCVFKKKNTKKHKRSGNCQVLPRTDKTCSRHVTNINERRKCTMYFE